MRRARYDMKRVICRNSSCIGYSSNVAKPGYWVEFVNGLEGTRMLGRVLGRIAEHERQEGEPWGAYVGHLAVVTLGMSGTWANVRWVDPGDVIDCYKRPPARLLAWLTGEEWVKSKSDIARIIAMNQHGTLSDEYIDNRDKPDQAYNARPEYVAQFILKD